MSLLKDITAQKFGKLTVLYRVSSSPKGNARWRCLCECGKEKDVSGSHLRSGGTKTCGCLSANNLRAIATKHGLRRDKDPRYLMLRGAKYRAKKNNIPFDLEVSDIVIPEICPILGIELKVAFHPYNSPSLDRIVPDKGYVKGNVWVVSWKANIWKSNYTLEQLKSFILILSNKIESLKS